MKPLMPAHNVPEFQRTLSRGLNDYRAPTVFPICLVLDSAKSTTFLFTC